MIRSRFRSLFLLAAVLLILPTTTASGISQARAQVATPAASVEAVPPPLGEAMPLGTSAYVATEFNPAGDQYLELSSLAAQVVIPGAGDTIGGIVQQLTRLLAMIPSDLNTVLTGEVGVGLSGFGGLDDTSLSTSSLDPGNVISSLLPSYAMVLHPIEAGKARELIEDWFGDQVGQSGHQVERSETGSIVVLRNPGADSASSSSPAVVVFSGDYILLGADYDSLLPYIDVTQGSEPSLANAPDLQRLNAALPSERLLFGYLDSAVLLESAAFVEVASVPLSSIEPPLGPTAFTVAADDIGLRIESVSLPTDSTTMLPDTSGENPDYASRVPDSTLALLASQDLGQSWVMEQLQIVLLTALAGSMGAGEIDLSDFEVEEQFGFLSMLTGINFKTDMIDQLQGDYGAALLSVNVDDPLASSVVVASDVDDSDRVSVAVTSLGPLIQSSGAGTASVTTASIDGQTVTNVTVGTNGLATRIQYGVVDGQLMIGLGDGIETIANPIDATLESSSAYRAALDQLPAAYDSLIYVDTRAIARQIAPLLLETLAQDSSNALIECLARGMDVATPAAVETEASNGGNWIVNAGCSIVTSLLGGDDALLDLILTRVPGPFAAVGYHESGLQHLSGVLMVGSIES